MASNYWKAAPTVESVAHLRRSVAEYATAEGVPAPIVEDVVIALSEVLGTCVMHDDSDDGELMVTATVNGDEVTVRVVDDGAGIKPLIEPPGAGTGLAIAGWVSRRMVVERPERGGTDVRLTFSRTS